MDIIFNKVCILVTAAFALTLVPGFRLPERSLLSRRDQRSALLVFLVLGLVEEVTASYAGWINERIVAVCAAGLLAGPWVGLMVGVFVTSLAVVHDGLPLGCIATAMLCGGLAGGWLYRWQPKQAQQPLTGFGLTLAVSLLGSGLLLLSAPNSSTRWRNFEQIGIDPILQGMGTALILAIVLQVRDRDEQTRAAASAEVRALQARMNPHFLFNALNTLAALSRIAPREVPRAVGRLRHFLRASFDQHERALVPLQEELAIVEMYLDIEILRFGSRLRVEREIDPGLSEVLLPPFSLQPLIENAVRHGLHSSPEAGLLRLVVRAAGPWLELSVTDDGQGVPSAEVEQHFFAEGHGLHALALLRRRLQGLFGDSFQLEVRSGTGEGTTVTIRILRLPAE
jgi:two-component system, LytTR family, sensor kinase